MVIRKRLGSQVFDSANAFIMIILILATLYPFYYIAIVSISDGNAVMQGKVNFFPRGFNLESYKLILKDISILGSYSNTIIYTVVGTAINILISSLCAYPLSRRDFFGRNTFTALIIFTMIFQGGLIPTYLVVKKLGMINTIWAIVLPGAVSTYNMIIMRTFFQGIPNELNESASLDGANDIHIFLRIVIPLSLPILATMVLFYSVAHWNSFFSAMIYLNDKNKFPIQIVLRSMVISGQLSEQGADMGSGSDFMIIDTTIKYAVIIIATLPILAVYPFVQKYFVKGVMIGSLKG